jgi:hypothetical protein
MPPNPLIPIKNPEPGGGFGVALEEAMGLAWRVLFNFLLTWNKGFFKLPRITIL